jgi:heme-degrading monooxygenase HmoA
MYIVVNHLHFDRPVDGFSAPVANEGLPLLQSLPGFKDFYFVKVTDDRAIVILVWQDAASAYNGAKAFGPTWFDKNLAPYLASEQQRSSGEVLVSHG